jgi:hypothetical protein
VPNKASESKPEDYVPFGMRSARRVRNNVWPYVWISFASILLLMAALVILSYRIGAHRCP